MPFFGNNIYNMQGTTINQNFSENNIKGGISK